MAPKDPIYKKSEYPFRCYLVGAYLIITLIGSLLGILLVHIGVVPRITMPILLRPHVMCAFFGMAGASMAAIRKYYRVLITETVSADEDRYSHRTDWSWGWVYYYLTRPLLGSVLGALSFTLSFVGVNVLVQPHNIEISGQGRYLLYGLAFVSGFAVSHVLDRLNSIAKQVFETHNRES